MGTISSGIMGGFSGKVGPVVGGSWKGVKYMRGLQSKTTKPRSPKQLAQQARFVAMIRFLKPLQGLLSETYRNTAIRMTEFNNATSFNMKNAVAGVYPDYYVETSLLVLSRGDLPNAPLAAATCTVAGELSFTWKDNSGIGKANAADKSILIAYSPDQRRTVYTIEGAPRSAEVAVLTVSDFSGLKVETYLAFIAADGTIANSVYAGQVTIF